MQLTWNNGPSNAGHLQLMQREDCMFSIFPFSFVCLMVVQTTPVVRTQIFSPIPTEIFKSCLVEAEYASTFRATLPPIWM